MRRMLGSLAVLGALVGALVQTSARSEAGVSAFWVGRAPANALTASDSSATSVIEGRVLLVRGNCQPTEPGVRGDCTVTPLKRRKVLVFAPPLSAGGFRGKTYVGGRRAARVLLTDSTGRYRTRLPAGVYTIVAEDRLRPYCNFFTRLACAVRLTPSRVLRYDIRIDHSTI